MGKFSKKVFQARSYTPIPFLILMVIFEQATLLSLIIGFLLVALGEFGRVWGVGYAGSATRTTGKVGARVLVTSGPFAYVRNPLYVSNMLVYLGVGIMSMALFPYLQIAALIFFYVQYQIIIKEEEGFLTETFGEEYQQYINNVPRLIPRITPYKGEKTNQPEFNIKKGFRSERRTLQAISAIVLVLIILYLVRTI
jgi:protein-S-isoprenylcysteine O-methyltransferase Ste14